MIKQAQEERELRGVPLSRFKAEDVPHLAALFSFVGLPSEGEAVKHLEKVEKRLSENSAV